MNAVHQEGELDTSGGSVLLPRTKKAMRDKSPKEEAGSLACMAVSSRKPD